MAVPVQEVGESRAVAKTASAVEMAEMKVVGTAMAAKEMQLPELGVEEVVEEGMAAVRVARIG